MNINVSFTGKGGLGTEASPIQSGGLVFDDKSTGVKDRTISHRWIKGGAPTDPDMVENWFKREGPNPSFTISPKQSESILEVTFSFESWEGEVESTVFRIFVMAEADEPEDTFPISCDDGLVRVTISQFESLKREGVVIAPSYPDPHWWYPGTKDELLAVLEDPEPEPLEPVNPFPGHGRVLQMCYAPMQGFNYDVNNSEFENLAWEEDLDHMWHMGVKIVNLWIYTQHIFYGTNSFNKTNHVWGWYRDFIDRCHSLGMKVILKAPFWGLPSWFDHPGVPERGTAKYEAHMDAKKQMIKTGINPLEPDGVMIANEPQLMCSVYPTQPVADGPPADRWPYQEILKITNDLIDLWGEHLGDGIIRIGPSVSAAISSILEPGDYLPPDEFIEGMVGSLRRHNYRAVAVNAYQLDVFSKPTAANYGAFYHRLAEIYPLWPSEMGVARKNQPSDYKNLEHLGAMIDVSVSFSPNIFSYFIYRDFNEDGWGLIHKDGSLDVRAEFLDNRFAEKTVMLKQALPVRVRTSHSIDAGIYLVNSGTEDVAVTLSFYSEDDGFKGDKLIMLQPYTPTAKNVWGDWKIDEVDMVLVESVTPVGALAVWVTKADHPYNYSGFPAVKL